MAGCIRGEYKRRLLQTLNSLYINQMPASATAPREWRGLGRDSSLRLFFVSLLLLVHVYMCVVQRRRRSGDDLATLSRQCKRMDGCINGDVPREGCIDAKVINNLGPAANKPRCSDTDTHSLPVDLWIVSLREERSGGSFFGWAAGLRGCLDGSWTSKQACKGDWISIK